LAWAFASIFENVVKALPLHKNKEPLAPCFEFASYSIASSALCTRIKGLFHLIFGFQFPAQDYSVLSVFS
jgi:hypothetical protein